MNSQPVQNAAGGARADYDAVVAGIPAGVVRLTTAGPLYDNTGNIVDDPELQANLEAASKQLTASTFNALAIGPGSNPDAQAGYAASMQAQQVAGIALGVYGVARAGISELGLATGSEAVPNVAVATAATDAEAGLSGFEYTDFPTLPEGYNYAPDGATVVGPNGGVYTPSGAVDANGNIIYRLGSGGYNVLDPIAGNTSVPSPFPAGAITDNGFQNALHGATGLPENTVSVTVPLPDGTVVTTVPDIIDNQVGIVEAKSNLYLTNSPQLQAQALYAVSSGQPYTLVVAPYTQISQPLVDQIQGIGGSIYRFDPVAQTFTPY